MDFDKAIHLYLQCRDEIEDIDNEAKRKKAVIREKMNKLEQWITGTAEQQGLKDVPTKEGTGYWSVHAKCSVADPAVFFEYVRNNERWDLMEKRASKSGVSEEIDATGEDIPGVNFSRVRVFNVRRTKDKAA